ncbi:hypothetical protein HMPREF1579_01327, partial [Gardnerella vaginalis JCP8066]
MPITQIFRALLLILLFVRDLGQKWYKVRKIVRALRSKHEGRSKRKRDKCNKLYTRKPPRTHQRPLTLAAFLP